VISQYTHSCASQSSLGAKSTRRKDFVSNGSATGGQAMARQSVDALPLVRHTFSGSTSGSGQVPYSFHQDRCVQCVSGRDDEVQRNRNADRCSAAAYDSGQTHLLLQLHGTIPITYRSQTYHIPIIVWFPLEYPRRPPIAYVNPTKDMLIRKSKEVEPSGKVGGDMIEMWERKWEVSSGFGGMQVFPYRCMSSKASDY